MLPPLDTPVTVNPVGRIGLITLIKLVALLAKFISRNQDKIRAWLSENTSDELVQLFDQLVEAIDAFRLSVRAFVAN